MEARFSDGTWHQLPHRQDIGQALAALARGVRAPRDADDGRSEDRTNPSPSASGSAGMPEGRREGMQTRAWKAWKREVAGARPVPSRQGQQHRPGGGQRPLCGQPAGQGRWAP